MVVATLLNSIFQGGTIRWARLLFSAERARWVANEQWHPQQQGKYETGGSYLLRIPYADHRMTPCIANMTGATRPRSSGCTSSAMSCWQHKCGPHYSIDHRPREYLVLKSA